MTRNQFDEILKDIKKQSGSTKNPRIDVYTVRTYCENITVRFLSPLSSIFCFINMDGNLEYLSVEDILGVRQSYN